MLPFRADIWSYLPLAKLHCFCNFRDNLCSNEWISMKLCTCKSLSAWMVLFSFWPDICSYLPLAKFHEFCNFRDNLSSDGWNSMKLCSCNDFMPWIYPFGFGPDICSYLPLAKFHGFCKFGNISSTMECFSMKFYMRKPFRAWMRTFRFEPLSVVICPWQNFTYSAFSTRILVLMNGTLWNFIFAMPWSHLLFFHDIWPDIWSCLPLAFLHRFCIDHHILSSTKWIIL